MTVKAFKIREAADELGVSYGTIRNAIRRGRLIAYRFEGTFRILPVDLSAYRDRCVTAAPEAEIKAPAPKVSSLKHLDGARLRAAWLAQGVPLPPTGGGNARSSGSKRGPSTGPTS
jgi:excisionase family DNA binding protein